MGRKEKNVVFICGFLWFVIAIVIFAFSSQNVEKSYEVSSGVVNTVNQTVNQVVEWSRWTILRRFLWNHHRKIAHIFLYAIMGALGSLTLKDARKGTYKGMGLGMLINVLYAIGDEAHQSIVPGRSAELSDLIIDIIGILCGLILIYVLCLIKRKKRISKIV